MTDSAEPLVSTIIPTFNRAQLVRHAVRSALAQSYARHEVLVIDNGSSDDTRAVLEREFSGRIRYILKPHGGVSSGRNRGLAEARGDLICFLDSDDEWHVDKVALQVSYLEAHPDLGMVMTDYMWVTPKGQVIRIQHRRAALPRDGHILDDVLRDPTIVPSTAMIRRSVYDAIGGFDESLDTAEDIDFYLRIASRFGIGLLEQPLTRYMTGHDSLSKPKQAYDDYARVMERFIKTVPGLDPERRRAALFDAYRCCARGLIWMGDYAGAARFGARAAGQARTLGQLGKLSTTSASFVLRLGAWFVGEIGANVGRPLP
jgi:glycosyltransferase involved in cell wall biosynthesis